MKPTISRKRFFSLITLGGAAAYLASPNQILAQAPLPSASASLPPKPPALDKDLVKQFVINGHSNLAGTKELLDREPGLLNACWDWGGGDFETALEGAGHMGNKEIANFLIARGARMNIFCAAMLGNLDVVQSLLTIYPNLKTSKGPHGLQLVHHATKGRNGGCAGAGVPEIDRSAVECHGLETLLAEPAANEYDPWTDRRL